jgi:hypothetical protein
MTITIYDLAAWKAKAERLEAENERLREALTEISNQAGDSYDDDDENNASLLATIERLANTALQPRTE